VTPSVDVSPWERSSSRRPGDSKGPRTGPRETGVETSGPIHREIREWFRAWVQPRLDLRFAAVVGSRGRADRPADEWSDLDIESIVEGPSAYLWSTDWPRELGSLEISFIESKAAGVGQERRVLVERATGADLKTPGR
jgi:hypothetical protein